MKVICLLAVCALFAVAAASSKDFFETFEGDWESRWVRSKDPKYEGVWKAENDSLVLASVARHHGISHKFEKPFTFDKDIVIQYEVKFTQTHQCGGAYIKLVSQENFKPEAFKDDTPYTIMFGPDKCGSTDKVHFIFRHKNPITKSFEEKHLRAPPMGVYDQQSHVYTLVIRTDDTYEIWIDEVSKKAGKLLEDFEPPVNPAKEIDDPEDKKPADWVDDAKIPDPDATKPEDWDEDAPRMIPDANAQKPEGWLDDEPAMIADPEAEMPEDWDEETDGEWEAPKIKNPKCDPPAGCGEWTAPMIPNPAFKGKWHAPLIDNPAYKGPWKARQIANPNFFEDLHPHKLTPITGLGIEVWTMQENIAFDNMYIGYNLEKAKEIAGKTLAAKEKAAAEQTEQAQEEEEEAEVKSSEKEEL